MPSGGNEKLGVGGIRLGSDAWMTGLCRPHRHTCYDPKVPPAPFSTLIRWVQSLWSNSFSWKFWCKLFPFSSEPPMRIWKKKKFGEADGSLDSRYARIRIRCVWRKSGKEEILQGLEHLSWGAVGAHIQFF